MSAQFRDYYQTLGVSKTATPAEIKSAFRKLARQFHPDTAKDKKAAEEKFKEINEAYEVLGDAEKRKRYDEYGQNWQHGPPPGGGFRGGARGPGGGFRQAPRSAGSDEDFEFGGTGFSDFFEQMFAGRRGSRAGFEEAPQRGQDAEADILVTLEEALRPSPLKSRRASARGSEFDSSVKAAQGLPEAVQAISTFASNTSVIRILKSTEPTSTWNWRSRLGMRFWAAMSPSPRSEEKRS